MKTIYLTIFLVFSPFILLLSQVAPPDPCDDGSQATCQCENSPVLCTIDDLDGFEYSMSDFQHPEDGPDFLCNGEGVPNNPTWFSFVAWCEELELEVELENCSDVCLTGGPCDFLCNFFGNCASGVQIAIYGDCNFNEEVACNVQDCNNENDKTLSMSNLTIGKTYHFVIDGCGGSACELVRVNVVGTCGDPIIENWSNPIQGPDVLCFGSTTTYFVDSLDGANQYTWSIDGIEIQTTQDPRIDIPWNQEGSFTLCVEASNERCPVTNGPDGICLTVDVIDPAIADLSIDLDSVCPGERVTLNASSENSNPGLQLAIIVVDENDTVRQLEFSEQSTFRFDGCGSFTAYAVQTFDSQIDMPEVGDLFIAPNCSQSCCDLIQLPFLFVDEEAPTFNNPPLDTVFDCFNAISEMEPLEFQDNCIQNGISFGVEEGLLNYLDGDTITRQWSVVDNCGNETIHVQKIQIGQNSTVDVNIIPASAEAILGETIMVEVSTNLEAENIANVLWEPQTNLDCTDCLSTFINALTQESYTITVTDTNGCSGQAEFQLFVRQDDIDIFIPNIFTPNGDGVNDGFTLFSSGFLSIEEFVIYDRWGKLVYESRDLLPNDTDMGWNGRYESQRAPQGVYVYSFLIRYADGTSEILKGTVTVSR